MLLLSPTQRLSEIQTQDVHFLPLAFFLQQFSLIMLVSLSSHLAQAHSERIQDQHYSREIGSSNFFHSIKHIQNKEPITEISYLNDPKVNPWTIYF